MITTKSHNGFHEINYTVDDLQKIIDILKSCDCSITSTFRTVMECCPEIFEDKLFFSIEDTTHILSLIEGCRGLVLQMNNGYTAYINVKLRDKLKL